MSKILITIIQNYSISYFNTVKKERKKRKKCDSNENLIKISLKNNENDKNKNIKKNKKSIISGCII